MGALGHSAGGYTVLALAGGQPDLRRIAEHCAAERAADPIFCRTGGTDPSKPAPVAALAASALPDASAAAALTDLRVRVVAAPAPEGVVFSAESLARIRLPVAL